MKTLFKTFSELRSFKAGDETEIREALHPMNDGQDFGYSLAHATLQPGQASKPHILHGRSETYIIERGSGRAYIGDQEREVGVGDVVFIPGGERQHIENTGGEPLRFWCVVCPPWSADSEEVEE